MEFIDDTETGDEGYDDADDREVDEMLDALVESDEDLSERKKRRRGRAKKPVSTAKGANAYREPGSKEYVTQKQLQTALGRVGEDVRRNALGIKTLNGRAEATERRVDGVVLVNTTQSTHIARLDYQMKVDGALELANAFNGGQLNLPTVFRGAVKSGLIGDKKGSLGSPLLIGVIAFVLQNNPNILGNLLPGAAPGAAGRI